MAGGTPVIVSLKEEDKFKLKKEQLEAAVTDKTKAMIISFPNNPTGAIMTREELEPIAEFAKEHDIVVISDEIYSELTYRNENYAYLLGWAAGSISSSLIKFKEENDPFRLEKEPV